MAKGSAMGIWRGRKGSSVFYYIKNSSNAQKQGIRERNYEVSNPRSYAQAGQRMKLLAVQRFYNQMKDVLERGFEGVNYGTPTRRKFLKYALKADLAGIASLPKDETIVPPSELLVSRGSLCECSLESWQNNENSVAVNIHVPFFSQFQADTLDSDAVITQNIVEYYKQGGGKEGDQITILYCIRQDGVFNYQNVSWLMKAGESVPNIDELAITNDEIDVISLTTNSANLKLVGAAVIVSREDGTKHLRSTSMFTVNKYQMQDYFSNAARLNARRSYMKSEVLSNDWPADPEDTTDGEGNVQGTVTVINLSPGYGHTPAQVVTNAGDIITLTVTPNEGYSAYWYTEREAVNLIGRGNTMEWTVLEGQQQLYVEFVGNDVP